MPHSLLDSWPVVSFAFTPRRGYLIDNPHPVHRSPPSSTEVMSLSSHQCPSSLFLLQVLPLSQYSTHCVGSDTKSSLRLISILGMLQRLWCCTRTIQRKHPTFASSLCALRGEKMLHLINFVKHSRVLTCLFWLKHPLPREEPSFSPSNPVSR